jgi:hypothetical protein
VPRGPGGTRLPLRVANGLMGIQFHRYHRGPGDHPVISKRSFAPAVSAFSGAGFSRSSVTAQAG